MSDEAWQVLKSIAATLGPGGALLLMGILYMVNKERLAKDKALMQMIPAGIKAMNSATNAINALRGEVKRSVAARRRKAGR